MATIKQQAVSPLVVDTSERLNVDRGGDESFDESMLEGMLSFLGLFKKDIGFNFFQIARMEWRTS